MRPILTFFFLLLAFASGAQNYNCFVPGKKQYFTNGSNYIRGIRIDSVVSSGSDTIYYPFHTPRGGYQDNSYGNLNFVATVFDSTGGSWVGKKVIKQQDGTFLFDNIWNDTTVIKTQAQPGDNWVFFNDSSRRYYIASIASVDTMTINSIVDSIKNIKITAYRDSSLNSADSINFTPIILSQHNGFLKVPDLYTFPYNYDTTISNPNLIETGIDYYLDVLSGHNGGVYRYGLSSWGPNNYSFAQIDFQVPTKMQLYNWSVGDVYCYSIPTGLFVHYVVDTVTNVVTAGTYKQYTYSGFINTQNYSNGPSYGQSVYTKTTAAGIITIDNSLIIDTSRMPEEYRQTRLIFYNPYDTSMCAESAGYNIPLNLSISAATYQGDHGQFEELYKSGIGLEDSSYYTYTGEPENTYYSSVLTYYYKNGAICGNTYTSVNKLTENNTVEIYPSPASTQLIVKVDGAIPNNAAIVITDLLGRTIYNGQLENNNQTIDVHSLANGLYNLSIVNADGSRMNEKVVVNH